MKQHYPIASFKQEQEDASPDQQKIKKPQEPAPSMQFSKPKNPTSSFLSKSGPYQKQGSYPQKGSPDKTQLLLSNVRYQQKVSPDKTQLLLSDASKYEKKGSPVKSSFYIPAFANYKKIKAPFVPGKSFISDKENHSLSSSSSISTAAASVKMSDYQNQAIYLIPSDVEQVPPTILNTQINTAQSPNKYSTKAADKNSLFKIPTTPKKSSNPEWNKKNSQSPHGPKKSNNIRSPESPKKQIFSFEAEIESEHPIIVKSKHPLGIKRHLEHPELLQHTQGENQSEAPKTTLVKFSKTKNEFNRSLALETEFPVIDNAAPITPVLTAKETPADFETPNSKLELGERQAPDTGSTQISCPWEFTLEETTDSTMQDEPIASNKSSSITTFFHEHVAQAKTVSKEQNELALLQFDYLKKADLRLRAAQQDCDRYCEDLQSIIEDITDLTATPDFSNENLAKLLNDFTKYFFSYKNFKKEQENFTRNYLGAGTKRLDIADLDQRVELYGYWQHFQKWNWSHKFEKDSIYYTNLALEKFWNAFKKIPSATLKKFEKHLSEIILDPKQRMIFDIFVDQAMQDSEFQAVITAIEEQLMLKQTYRSSFKHPPLSSSIQKEKEPETAESKTNREFKNPRTILLKDLEQINANILKTYSVITTKFKDLDDSLENLIQFYSPSTETLESSQPLNISNNLKIKCDIYINAITVATELLEAIDELETLLNHLNKKTSALQSYALSLHGKDWVEKQVLTQRLDETIAIKQKVQLTLQECKNNTHSTLRILSKYSALDSSFNLLDLIPEHALTQSEKDLYNDFILSEDKPSLESMISKIHSKDSSSQHFSFN